MAGSSAGASSPPLAWQGAARVQLLCVLASHAGDRLEQQTALCERVRAKAASASPLPVRTIAVGDPAVLAQDAVTLLVHASLRPVSGQKVLAFTIRPYRASTEPTDILFGAAPRAVAFSDTAAVDAAVAEALGETLPWRAQTEGARPLS